MPRRFDHYGLLTLLVWMGLLIWLLTLAVQRNNPKQEIAVVGTMAVTMIVAYILR